MNNTFKIATHSGQFHADDVMAVAMLLIIKPEAVVVRTRDPKEILGANIAVDVGGGLFDHHQKGGNGARVDASWMAGIPYSSAGLIWREFGDRIIMAHLDYLALVTDVGYNQDWVNKINVFVDQTIVEPIDAIDNGIEVGGLLSFSSVVSMLNPAWGLAAIDVADDLLAARFQYAVEMARELLKAAIEAELARQIATEAVKKAFTAAKQTGKQYMVLDQGMPWISALEVIDVEQQILYVLYPSDDVGQWQIRTVPEKAGAFGARKDLPAAWAGLRDAELQAASDVADAVFCHNGLFIGGAKTKEGVVKMAEMAINAS